MRIGTSRLTVAALVLTGACSTSAGDRTAGDAMQRADVPSDSTDGNTATDGTAGTTGSDGTSAVMGTDGNTGGVPDMDYGPGTDGPAPSFADVQVIFEDFCTPCHQGESECSGNTCFVSSYAEASKDSEFCNGVSVAACSVVRIEDGTMPLGGGVVPEEDVADLRAWLSAGLTE